MMEGQEDRKERPPRTFFSRIKQRVEPLEYFLRLLGLLLKYASLIDSCDQEKREIVWKHIIDLYNSDVASTSDLFSPVVAVWRNSKLMDLEAIEMYYLGFSNALLEQPNLLESSALPFPVPSRVPPIPAGFKMVWGSGIISQLQQLSLLFNWAPRIDKLAPKHKEFIWSQCEMFACFTPDEFDRSSYKHTLCTWAENPARYLPLVTVMFVVIGYLSECGVIKYRFCYPNTVTSVYSKQPSKTKFNKEEYALVVRKGVDAVPHPESEFFPPVNEDGELINPPPRAPSGSSSTGSTSSRGHGGRS